MKPWKIITVTAFALIAVAFITSTAFAYMGTQATYNASASTRFNQGPRGGMMRGAYANYGGYWNSTSIPQQYGQPVCGCGCWYP